MSLRAPSSLSDQLKRQIGYLERSCALFDTGIEDEAQRLATTIRVLFHDTRSSTSLLTLLDLKSTIQMVDTGIYRDRLNAAKQEHFKTNSPDLHAQGYEIVGFSPGDAGLVTLAQRGNRAAWVAPLGNRPLSPDQAAAAIDRQPFESWWTLPLIETGELNYFSRKKLILIMANQDGGAHVDPNLDREYEALTVDCLGAHVEFGNDLVDKTMGGDIPEAEGNVAAASVRQIAYEVLETLKPIV